MGLLGRRVVSVLLKKGVHTTFEEVKIPVPWGHVAGKWWGSKERQPVLAFHGWQDNAGTWDPLIKLLPEKLSILAIDFPGSGFSSHLPPLQTYHFSDSAIIVERIRRHFGFKEKLDLLGHSGGSVVAFMYSTLFPENVKSYFGVDYVIYAYTNQHSRAERIGSVMDKAIALSQRDPNKAKPYTWDEAANVWVSGTFRSVSRKSAEILMERGTRKLADGKVVFSRDNCLKAQTTEMITTEQAEDIASSLRCHVSLVKGKKSHLFDQGLKHVPGLVNVIKKHAKTFEFHEIDGGHHLHMDVPELIAPLFLKLLDKE